MHTLIVTAHPESGALTHAIARRIGQAITASDAANRVTHADLVAEGFDPRFNMQDQALFRGTGATPADVAAEQGWTRDEALFSLARKAGWVGGQSRWRELDLRVTRYQGKKKTLSYARFRKWRDWVEQQQ